MRIALMILGIVVLLQWAWILWLLWDRGKKIQAISARRKDIRILQRELKRMEERMRGARNDAN